MGSPAGPRPDRELAVGDIVVVTDIDEEDILYEGYAMGGLIGRPGRVCALDWEYERPSASVLFQGKDRMAGRWAIYRADVAPANEEETVEYLAGVLGG